MSNEKKDGGKHSPPQNPVFFVGDGPISPPPLLNQARGTIMPPPPPSPDPWLAADKLQHLVFCAAVAAAAYLVARASPSPRLASARLAVGAGAAFVAGATKEAGDAAGLWPGRPSLRDGAADAVGAAAALAALAWADAVAPGVLDRVAPRRRTSAEEDGVPLRARQG